MATNPLARVPAFGIRPPLRCHFRQEHSPRQVCGALAAWKRPGNHLFATRYFCDEHRQASDLELGSELVVRRVRISVDVLFAAACLNDTLAQAEALERLEQAVHGVGGLLDVQAARVSLGRYGG